MMERAVANGIDFRIIYVDNRQENYCKTMFNYLVNKEVEFYSKLGISVTYTFINGISNVIDKVTKVFIKAKSMLSNGSLLGSVGTSLVSCVAYNFKKPVIAFSETFKFWDKIKMNSLQNNNMLIERTPAVNFSFNLG
jgi:translation initiation factor 2B subunit (eIF-2B alpha/beta/delta family)